MTQRQPSTPPSLFTARPLAERLLQRALADTNLTDDDRTQLTNYASNLQYHPNDAAEITSYYLARAPSIDSAIVAMHGNAPVDVPYFEGVINVLGSRLRHVGVTAAHEAIAPIEKRLNQVRLGHPSFRRVTAGTTPDKVAHTIVRGIDHPRLYLQLSTVDEREADIGRITDSLIAEETADGLHKRTRQLIRSVGLAPISFALASGRLDHERSAYGVALLNRAFPEYRGLLPRLFPTRVHTEKSVYAEPVSALARAR